MNESEASQIAKFSVIREIPHSTMRISQDQIICEGDKTQNLMQSVVCPVCLMLLQMPHYVCESCDNAFCMTCLNDWRAKKPNSCIFKCQNPSFKVVKRSNTYNALMELLKIKCQHCTQPIPVKGIEIHDKICPKKIVPCIYLSCDQQIPRQQLKNHEQHCQFRPVNCKFCDQSLLVKDLAEHEESQCKMRDRQCFNKGCDQIIKTFKMKEHLQNCQFRQYSCIWCKDKMYYKDRLVHEDNCEQKEYGCKWCAQTFNKLDFSSHLCAERKQTCELCESEVKITDFKQHKLDCMFNYQIQSKKADKILMEENIKLKLLVQQLKSQLDEYRKNCEQSKFQALIKIANEERRQSEKDLLRLNNGIQNLRKLREAEHKQHLKKPHFSQSLCPFCNSINNKLQEDIAPLVRQRKEVETKIYENDKVIARINYVCKKNKEKVIDL